MANQHKESFAHIAPKKFGKSAEELLREFEKDGISYIKATEITGFKENTIRKWCVLYGIKLALTKPFKVKVIEEINVKSKTINTSNFLYRKWQLLVNTRDNITQL